MTKSNIVIISITLAIGLAGGFIGSKFIGSNDKGQNASSSGEKEILYWKAPMDPNFRSPNPGKSPMGMDLVPVYAGGEDEDDRNLVKISPIVENNIGVRTAKVERADLMRNIETVGFVQIDDDKTASIDVRTEGWVEKLYVKSVGEPVSKGRPLFDLYSKPLVTAQEEYLQSVRIGRDSLIRAAKGRLLTLGLSEAQIRAVAKSGKVKRLSRFYAPQNGVVTMMGIGEGAFVRPGQQVMMLADLSSIWVLAEVFETQAGWVKPGQSVQMQVDSQPGRSWTGIVDYIYPVINSISRTVQVRLRFENSDGALKPQGYAKLTIETEPKRNVLVIDREALIRTGNSTRVILALGDGQFQPAEVSAGMESMGKVEITDGLKSGETIVVSSQFLLDSEASFRGTELRMTNQKPMAPKEADAKGVVLSLMADHGMITIQHEAIEAFGWPNMEMDFITEPAFLDNIKEGDAVHFKVLEIANDNDDFVVTSIMKIDANMGADK
ncbi:MAG: efflux RND transporter periplasmic adaptor subunit [Robiginitomaculum sp.]|nr:efflux RND transporter periplasmic adaptor subunit [Robiginitomaculum sp.]